MADRNGLKATACETLRPPRRIPVIRRPCILVMLLVWGGASWGGPDYLERFRDAGAVDAPVVAGRDGWLFFTPELRHLGVGAFWGDAAELAGRAGRPDARDPLPAILDFHRALEARGVALILVPVPPKAVIHADQLFESGSSPSQRPDRYHQAFYERLRAEGVTVLDLTGSFLEWIGERRGPPYCRQDTHWSGEGCLEAARQLAARIGPLLGDPPGPVLPVEWRTVEIEGDLWRMVGDAGLERERIPLRIVPDARIDPESPVLLLGDSHVLVFHAGDDLHARRAGLPDQLAAELGRPVDLVGVRGSGATPARISLFRRAQRDPTFWDRKQVVVWVFAAREFTESDGWRIVPIAP